MMEISNPTLCERGWQGNTIPMVEYILDPYQWANP